MDDDTAKQLELVDLGLQAVGLLAIKASILFSDNTASDGDLPSLVLANILQRLHTQIDETVRTLKKMDLNLIVQKLDPASESSSWVHRLAVWRDDSLAFLNDPKGLSVAITSTGSRQGLAELSKRIQGLRPQNYDLDF